VSNDELDEAFGALGTELKRAAIREAEIQSRLRKITRRSRWRKGALAIVAVLVPTAAVAGVNGLFPAGDPLPRDQYLPSVRAGIIPSSATPDPSGSLPWALQLQSRADGQDCLFLGRLRAGELGQIEKGRFRAYSTDNPGLCGDLQRDPILAFSYRRALPEPRTIVYGLAPDRAPVTLHIGGRQLRQAPRALGAYLFVLPGRQSMRGAEVSTRARGRAVSVRLR
jgi:hypothetical protein